MRTTKKSVLIETTNSRCGCLEQGGICGRVVAYPIEDVKQLIGCKPASMPETDYVDGYDYITARELIENQLIGRTIRRGIVIE